MLFHTQLTGAIGREYFGAKEGLIDKFYLRRLRDYVEDAIEARFGVRTMLGFGERSELRVVRGELPVPIDQVKRFLVGSIEDYITRHPVVRFR